MSLSSNLCGLSTKTIRYTDIYGEKNDASILVARDGLIREAMAWHISALMRLWLGAARWGSSEDNPINPTEMTPLIRDEKWFPGAEILYRCPVGYFTDKTIDGFFGMDIEVSWDDGRVGQFSLSVGIVVDEALYLPDILRKGMSFNESRSFNLLWQAFPWKIKGEGIAAICPEPGWLGQRMIKREGADILDCFPHRQLKEVSGWQCSPRSKYK